MVERVSGEVPGVREGWPLWVVAAIAAIAYGIVFYPGAMSFDSAYQWWQARGGTSTNIQSVGMTWLWRAGNALAPGPGVMFAVQLLLFWSGLVLTAQSLAVSLSWRALFMLVTAIVPVTFVLFSHVWSDVMLMAVLTFAVGTILLLREGRRLWLWPTGLLLFVAATLRHNAAAAVLPLLIYTVHLSLTETSAGLSRLRRTVLIALLVAVLIQSATSLLERAVDSHRTLFAATAQWDLAAISIDVGKTLLPPESYFGTMTLDDLRRAFKPYANTSLFIGVHVALRQPFFAPDDPVNDRIRHAWIDAVTTYPRSYLAHRWQVTKALFGRKSRDWPGTLVYFEGTFQYNDNPPVAPNTTGAHAWCLRVFDAIRGTVLLSAWPYLCVTGIALIVAFRRRREVDMRPAFAVLSSGLLYAAPLPWIAPAAELRYVGWTCLAALIGAALAFAAPRKCSSPLARG